MRRVLIIVAFFVIFSLVFGGRGGPDRYGYRWIDSDEPRGPTFNWIDITGTGTRLTMTSDQVRTITLPAGFVYYDSVYNRITICSNGWVAFGSWSSPTSVSGRLPNTASPNNTLAAMFTNLYPPGASWPGGIYYQGFPDKFVVSYVDIPQCCSATMPKQTFQIILYYDDFSIVFQYLDVEPLSGSTSFDAHIGWENRIGNDGVEIGTWSSRGGVLHDSLTIKIAKFNIVNPPFLATFDVSTDGFWLPDDSSSGWNVGFVMPSTGLYPIPSGMSAIGTRTSGFYENNADWVIFSPYLDATNTTHPIIDFWHAYKMQLGHDGGIVEISTDAGASWTIVEPENGGYPVLMTAGPLSGRRAFSGIDTVWKKVSFDLQPYAGEEILIRFHFYSDASVNDWGWYIDNFGFHEAYGTVKGAVDLLYFTPDSGAHVKITDLGLERITDPDGKFTFDTVVVGTHKLIVEKEGFVPSDTINFTIDRFDTLTLNIPLSPELYHEDFADTDGGMIPDPIGGWQWGRPILGPDSAHSDSFCWGTNLGGNYANNCNWKLMIAIPLFGVHHPTLMFYHWYKFNGKFGDMIYDGGNVKVSTDGGATWHLAYPREGYDGVVVPSNPYLAGQPAFGGEATTWHRVMFDLSEFSGVDTIWIRFEIGSDAYASARGWYIDDVSLIEGISVDEKPANLPRKIIVNAYPNPFNSVCRITIYPTKERANVALYDINGHLIKNFGDMDGSSKRELVWQPTDIPSGVYILKIKTQSTSRELKLFYLR
ncbi:immune inhibitor A [bacterium]|nr:immune inhibitor A [bacterium]